MVVAAQLPAVEGSPLPMDLRAGARGRELVGVLLDPFLNLGAVLERTI